MAAAVDPLAPFRLDDRVVIVTGASSGLGDRFARILHGVGARLVVTARRKERLDALVADLPGAVAVAADVAVAEDRERIVGTALDAFGTVDVLVNNAGISRATPIEDETLDDFRDVIEINLTAIWHLTKLVGVPMVAKGRGSIVNVASMLGTVAGAPVKQASYAASKGGVVNLTRELAVQWAREGVRVNALAPGWFPSEMTAPMQGDESSERFIKRNTPMARMGREDELDGALLLLASDAGSFITGHTLLVDGGWTAR